MTAAAETTTTTVPMLVDRMLSTVSDFACFAVSVCDCVYKL